MKESIYTLLIIAWVVYSIVKAVSKKKSSTSAAQGGKAESGHAKRPNFSTSIDSILNAVLDIKDANKGEMSIPYSDTARENPLENTPNYENYVEENKLDSYSGSDNITSAFVAKESEKILPTDAYKSVGNQNEEDETVRHHQPFDLRQAIINQVILERPY